MELVGGGGGRNHSTKCVVKTKFLSFVFIFLMNQFIFYYYF